MVSRLAQGIRLLQPAHALAIGRDVLRWRAAPGDSRRHLAATMDWLCRAQDRGGGGGGVSAGYSLIRGWLPPYPETTGYIIPTFFDYASLTGNAEFRTRAVRMAEWELRVQLPSGAIQAGFFRGDGDARAPAVFNTGQVVLGWCRAFGETRDERYLAAAVRAGEWLLQAQDPDGAWRQRAPETETTVHAYDARTAWSLLELSRLVDDGRLVDAARRNLDWTLAQQRDNGWFEHNAFFLSRDKWHEPLTHTIGYVMEGLMGGWSHLGDQRYWDAAIKTATRLKQIFERGRSLPGEFDRRWTATGAYSCLTGSAQVAGVWLRIYGETGDTSFLDAARVLNGYVKATQVVDTTNPDVRGGIKGSQPIFGRYTPFTFINWGAKFFADALMLETRVGTS
jgi:uncharacterized protein YyaL (SSP411 family)